MQLKSFLLVGAGGAVGSMARYAVSYLFSKIATGQFPAGTFIINVTGSLIIGILFGLTARSQWLQQGGILLLASGFCGGFTTFSTFAVENVNLMQKGESITSLIYIAGSVIIGLLLCRLGMWLTA